MTLRRMIQTVLFVYIIFVGWRFGQFIANIEAGIFAVQKPAAVEGFLPISAFMALKQLLVTGVYDMVHPAGLTILIAAILMSIVVPKSFCSHICPVGLVSELLGEWGLKWNMPRWLSIPLSSLKYLLLLFFMNVILLQMDAATIGMFLQAPYNIVADAKMLDFFRDPSRTTIIVVGVLVILSLLVKNPWCRFLCPYGALLGPLGLLSPFRVKRDASTCVSCKACSKVCPAGIQVHSKNVVLSPDCMGCYQCVDARHNETCLKVRLYDNPKKMSIIAVSVFFGVIGVAMLAGKWHSNVPNEMYAQFLSILSSLTH